jgi:hypothetical protein
LQSTPTTFLFLPGGEAVSGSARADSDPAQVAGDTDEAEALGVPAADSAEAEAAAEDGGGGAAEDGRGRGVNLLGVDNVKPPANATAFKRKFKKHSWTTSELSHERHKYAAAMVIEGTFASLREAASELPGLSRTKLADYVRA